MPGKVLDLHAVCMGVVRWLPATITKRTKPRGYPGIKKQRTKRKIRNATARNSRRLNWSA